MKTRKNQNSLTSREWDKLICAMKELKKSKSSCDWAYFTGLHKKYASHDGDSHDLPHLDGDDLHIHSDFYWLAWHRKFILEFEKHLREFESGVTLPYWDWSRQRAIPDELKKKLLGWMHVSRALAHNPDKLPSRRTMSDDVEEATSYSSFDNNLNNLHGQVHNWVGGTMKTNKSPDDPLFFLHHAFIDKTWTDWQTANTSQSFPSDHLDFTLPPWNTKVRDVLSIDDLDYEYR